MSLKSKVIRGTFWSVFGGVINQLFQMITFVVLGRILEPKDFGLMAYAFFFIGIVRMFTDFGLGYALIQKINADNDDYYSVFILSGLISLVLFLLIFSLSGVISNYAGEEELSNILKLISIIFVLDSLKIVPFAILSKKLLFKEIFINTLAGTIVYGTITIILSFMGFKTYSLVLGFIAASLVTTVITFVQARWIPKLIFNYNHTKDLLKFGVYQSGANFISYINDNLERFFLGKYYGATDLGIYHFSTKITTIPQVIIAQNVGKVIFPAFTEIQNQDEKLKEYYLKLINYLLYVSLPALLVVAIYCDKWIPLIFGDKWIGAIIPFRILMVSGMIAAVGSPLGGVYIAKGKSNYTFYMTSILLILTLVIYPISAFYGFIILCYSVMLYKIINLILIIYFCNKVIKAKFIDYWDTSKRPLYLTLLVIITNILIIFSENYYALPVILILIIVTIVNILILFFFLYFFDDTLYRLLKSIVQKYYIKIHK